MDKIDPYLPLLRRLLPEEWHNQHEVIIDTLASVRDPSVVRLFCSVLSISYPYIDGVEDFMGSAVRTKRLGLSRPIPLRAAAFAITPLTKGDVSGAPVRIDLSCRARASQLLSPDRETNTSGEWSRR